MPLPSFTNFVAGMKITAAQLNGNTQDAFNKVVLNKPVCHLTQTGTAQSFASNASFQIATLNSVVFDTDSMADLANNRVVIKTAGLYRLTVQAGFAANVTGSRGVTARVDGSYYPIMATVGAGTAIAKVSTSGIIRLAVNQNLQLFILQNSGATLAADLNYGGISLWLEWIAA